jgi:hypothetical protein
MPKALKTSQSRALGPALRGIKSNQHPNEFEDQAGRKKSKRNHSPIKKGFKIYFRDTDKG